MSRTLLLVLCAGLVLPSGAGSQKRPAAAKPAVKSALHKPTLEAYVRHLFVWGPQIQVTVGDAKPAARLPGFLEVIVRATAANASQDEVFYVSKDGRKILRAAVYEVTENPFKPEIDKLKTEFQPSFGTPGAPVVLVLFSDFQCAYCKEEAKTLRRELPSAYPKQVRLYFKDFPLESIHPWARMASIAGRCIFRLNPNAFWTYHDWIYEHQQEITPENVKSKVMEFGQAHEKEIDTLQLSRCLETRATEAEVDSNVADGKALQVNSTPTIFVNGRRLVGQVAWPNLRQIIDFEIKYQETANNAGEAACCEVKLPSPITN